MFSSMFLCATILFTDGSSISVLESGLNGVNYKSNNYTIKESANYNKMYIPKNNVMIIMVSEYHKSDAPCLKKQSII